MLARCATTLLAFTMAPRLLPCGTRASDVAMTGRQVAKVSLVDGVQPMLGQFARDAFFGDGDAAHLEDVVAARRLLLNNRTVGWEYLGSKVQPGDTVELLPETCATPPVDGGAPLVDRSASEPRLGCLKGRRISRSRVRPPAMIAACRRREALLFGTAAAAPCALPSPSARGDTSGRFTTVTTAKRRCYGRVKLGVFEFLAMGAVVAKDELQSDDVATSVAATVQTQAARTRMLCEGGDQREGV